METRWAFYASERIGLWCRIGAALALTVIPAYSQRYEVTPLVGAMLGGSVQLEQFNVSNFDAHLNDRLSYGLAAGVRWDDDECQDCNTIQFRWLRQNTHLGLDQNPFLPPPAILPSFNPRVSVNDFLGDFTREWPLKETKMVRPFLTVSLGAARLSTTVASSARFVFGFSTGLKVFPTTHWGFRFQVEYLPVVVNASLQRVVCAGGCLVALTGDVINQFQASIGPAFRF